MSNTDTILSDETNTIKVRPSSADESASVPIGSETTMQQAVRPNSPTTVADRPDDGILERGTGVFIGAAIGAVFWAIAIYLLV